MSYFFALKITSTLNQIENISLAAIISLTYLSILTINKNYKHILDDLNTSQRLPDSIKNSDRPLETLKGVIDTAIQKVIANYKLAVPHYYQNKIQLLVPLCFGKDDNPDVALVLDLMKNGYYQATTCLSMEMAYMDARLIAKPESNWLIAENITEE